MNENLLAPGTRVRLVRPLANNPEVPVGTEGVIEEVTYAMTPKAEPYMVAFDVSAAKIEMDFELVQAIFTHGLATDAPSFSRYLAIIGTCVAIDAVEPIEVMPPTL